jgi:hypothetical protein
MDPDQSGDTMHRHMIVKLNHQKELNMQLINTHDHR